MINHVRTLLLDMDGGSAATSGVGAQYVSGAYRKPTMSADLRTAWEWLFAPSPDKAFRDWRLHELMTIIHGSPELHALAVAYDPRLTYWPMRSAPFFDRLASGAVITEITSSPGPIYVHNLNALTSGRRLLQRWQVTLVDGTTATVRGWTDDGGVIDTTQSYTSSGGLTSLLTLPGSVLTASATATISATWGIECLARPVTTLATLATSCREIDARTVESTFVAGSEPDASYYALWAEHSDDLVALGALALALAQRLHEAWITQGGLG